MKKNFEDKVMSRNIVRNMENTLNQNQSSNGMCISVDMKDSCMAQSGHATINTNWEHPQYGKVRIEIAATDTGAVNSEGVQKFDDFLNNQEDRADRDVARIGDCVAGSVRSICETGGLGDMVLQFMKRVKENNLTSEKLEVESDHEIRVMRNKYAEEENNQNKEE